MEIPRIRILRHWDRTKTDMRGYWLLLIEPRWPIFSFCYEESLNELRGLFPTREDDTLDIVVEYFDRTKKPFAGGCKKTIWATDLFETTWWMKYYK